MSFTACKLLRGFRRNPTKIRDKTLRITYYNDYLDFTLFGCARLPDGRALNTLRKAVFARLRRERRLTRNRRSALLHLQSNKNRNFSLLSLFESLNLSASYKKLVLIRMFLTTFSRKSVILSEVDFVRITAVVMLNIDLYYESRRKKFCNKWY